MWSVTKGQRLNRQEQLENAEQQVRAAREGEANAKDEAEVQVEHVPVGLQCNEARKTNRSAKGVRNPGVCV